jgi:error-prone DNA polymerase
LNKLAAADAFRSCNLDRRQALWQASAITAASPLPLFQYSETREQAEEEPVALPAMPLGEHVVADYQTIRLSLKAHPVAFLRERFTARRIISAAELTGVPNGTEVRIAGVVLVRQRPGTASGVIFMTIEDETGIANAVVWSRVFERYRKVVIGSRLVLIRGRVERKDAIIHVIADHLEDFSGLLSRLGNDPAQAEAGVPNLRRHPRDVRIIPKSRDFK